MNTATIHVKTDIKTRDDARKIAGNFGFTLTSLLNVLLKQIVRTRRISIDLDEEPTRYMLESLKKTEADKSGRVISFRSGKDALDYLAREIKNDKQDSAH